MSETDGFKLAMELSKAETGGKIAQLGSRLITSTARKLAKAVFQSFEEIMNKNN